MTSHSDTTQEAPWREHLLETPGEIRALLERSRRVAVLGIKPDRWQPAHYVPEYAQRAGYEIVPVPVYYPDMTSVLGEPVYRRLMDVPDEIDIVNVFRNARDIPQHVTDILAKRPKAVWMQLGIRHDDVARELAMAGIDVVQDRCMLVELRRMGR
jgi:predicted CoA-binding protein